MTKVILFCAILWAAIPGLGQSQRPEIYGVTNTWNYAYGATAPVAQGSIVTITGVGLGSPTSLQAPSLPLTAALPNDPTGTSVQISTADTAYNAWILYAGFNRVGAIVPSNVPVGPATLMVTFQRLASFPLAITITRSSFGIFTKNGAGIGPATALNFISASNTPANALTASAQPGQVLILYGTGLGASLDGKDNTAPKVGNIANNVRVRVGSIDVMPLYAGRSSQYPGLDQINFEIPLQAPLGCYVPLTVSVGSISSNTVTVSISTANTCSHPLGLNAASLASLDGGGSVKIGAFQLNRQNGGPLQQSDSASGSFQTSSANTVFSATAQYVAVSATPPVGSCLTGTTPAAASTVFGAAYTVLPLLGLISVLNPFSLSTDAGSPLALALAGAATNPQTTLTSSGFSYSSPFGLCSGAGCAGPAFLSGGSWTLSSAGGADVRAFSANFTLPTMPQWTNAGTFDGKSVPRGNDLTVTWTGGGSGDVMLISGNGQAVDLSNTANGTLKSFICAAYASAGSFTVPAAILQTLPAASAPSATTSYYGSLGISTTRATNFTAPLSAGGYLDGGVIVWNFNSSRGVAWQ